MISEGRRDAPFGAIDASVPNDENDETNRERRGDPPEKEGEVVETSRSGEPGGSDERDQSKRRNGTRRSRMPARFFLENALSR